MRLIVHEPALRPVYEASQPARFSASAHSNGFLQKLQFLPYEEAIDAGEAKAGKYFISYSIGQAEGMYNLIDGEMKWCEPTGENIHIEISVREVEGDRFIPCLIVLAAVYTPTGQLVEARLLPFIWHPWRYHYGGNFTLPVDQGYTLRVRVEAPEYLDCQSTNCGGCPDPIEIEFRDILIRTSDFI
jgi:hypothetical protein